MVYILIIYFVACDGIMGAMFASEVKVYATSLTIIDTILVKQQ